MEGEVSVSVSVAAVLTLAQMRLWIHGVFVDSDS